MKGLEIARPLHMVDSKVSEQPKIISNHKTLPWYIYGNQKPCILSLSPLNAKVTHLQNCSKDYIPINSSHVTHTDVILTQLLR